MSAPAPFKLDDDVSRGVAACLEDWDDHHKEVADWVGKLEVEDPAAGKLIVFLAVLMTGERPPRSKRAMDIIVAAAAMREACARQHAKDAAEQK